MIGIEICELNDGDLSALVKKTFVLITTVGPYAQYGEHVSVLSHLLSHRGGGGEEAAMRLNFPLGFQSMC